MNKLLSIIIPTYNMEKYLHKCLDSLIVSDENMQLLEVLVINDGSKDSSSEIAHDYESRFPQTFRVIDKENGNYGSCINRGLKEATGKYVKVLDADDYFKKDVFNNFVKFLQERDEDVVITNTIEVKENGDILCSNTFRLIPNVHLSLSQLDKSDIFHMHSIAYKLEIIKKIGYRQSEGVSYSDNEWSTWPLIYMNSLVYYDDFLYCYLIGREGQTVSMDSYVKNRIQFLTVAECVMSKLSCLDSSSEAYPYLLNRIRYILVVIYRKLIVYDQCRHVSELEEFDKRMKENFPKYYSLLEDEMLGHVFKYPYISAWRKSNYKSVNLFIIKLQQLLCSIRDKCK